MNVFLNTYKPLASTGKGKQAIEAYNLPPFVDGSCRREPDLEKEYPAITCLCRLDLLLSRLQTGDLVIYMTNKKKYFHSVAERKFIGILEVVCLVESHETAKEWYLKNNAAVSQNVICDLTNPLAAGYTHQITDFKKEGEANIRRWDGAYKLRMKDYPKVAICKPWNELNLVNPMTIDDNTMRAVFGRIPGTQNPPKLTDCEWAKFQQFIIDV